MAHDLSREAERYLARAEQALGAARTLAKHGYLADALSKAYYAMFYAASAMLSTEELSVSKHSAVIALFGERFAKPGRIDPGLHRMLIDMFDERQVADYGVEIEITPKQAEAGLCAASEFVEAIQSYLRSEGS
jgi:uncharacterized protein (UPF0332 family)